jgi:hypothetical protein
LSRKKEKHMSDQALNEAQAKKLWAELDQEDQALPGNNDEPESLPAPGAAIAAPEQVAEEDDPYVGMTAYQKARLIGLEKQNEQLQQRVRNVEGHIGGLKSQLTARQAPAAATPGAAEAPTAAELQQAQSSPEAMQNLKRDYPEFAEAIEAVVGQSTAQLRAELARQQPQEAGLTQQHVHEAIVEFAHPKWKELVVQPEFVGWLEQQPEEVKRLAASDLAADAVKLLDTFKAPNPVLDQRNRRLESQAGIPSGRAGSSRGKSVDEMSDQEYWAHLDKLDKQGK